jgi:hypothetical protein
MFGFIIFIICCIVVLYHFIRMIIIGKGIFAPNFSAIFLQYKRKNKSQKIIWVIFYYLILVAILLSIIGFIFSFFVL